MPLNVQAMHAARASASEHSDRAQVEHARLTELEALLEAKHRELEDAQVKLHCCCWNLYMCTCTALTDEVLLLNTIGHLLVQFCHPHIRGHNSMLAAPGGMPGTVSASTTWQDSRLSKQGRLAWLCSCLVLPTQLAV